MKLKQVIQVAHSLVEANEKTRISQNSMADRIGVGHRTYTEYRRGTNAPLAMKALLNLLTQLDDKDVLRIVQHWRSGKD